MSGLVSRVVVAVVALPVVLGIVWLGGWWLFGLLAAAAIVGLHEYTSMTRQLRPVLLGGYIGVVAMLLGASRGGPVWLLGVGGLFGYHFFYFLAFRLAPQAAVEVNLLNYLWPLLIVLFSALLPGHRLKPGHVLGGLLGLAGTALLVTGKGRGLSIEAAYLPGYLSAAACASSSDSIACSSTAAVAQHAVAC